MNRGIQWGESAGDYLLRVAREQRFAREEREREQQILMNKLAAWMLARTPNLEERK